MGKKRIAAKGESGKSGDSAKSFSVGKLPRKHMEAGVLNIQATYNNTKAILTETNGNAVTWSSSGALGFKGAKKGTPFAATKIGELLGEKAKAMGMKEFSVVVTGVGGGREGAIRGFIATSGAVMTAIKDKTPIPFNGPRPPKPRRV